MRPEKSGRNIIVKNPDDFSEWLNLSELTAPDDADTEGGFLSRLFG
jgi:hypothetical protein